MALKTIGSCDVSMEKDSFVIKISKKLISGTTIKDGEVILLAKIRNEVCVMRNDSWCNQNTCG